MKTVCALQPLDQQRQETQSVGGRAGAEVRGLVEREQRPLPLVRQEQRLRGGPQ